MIATPDFRALLVDDAYAASFQSMGQYRTALLKVLATPPGPPKNCWLDDEPDLCPSPCVFDDPSEVINNCTYAQTVKCKTDCQYYRAATPPPEPPTDEEIEEWADACSEAPLEEMDPEVHGWRRCFTSKEFSETIRAALERWGK